MYQYSPSYVMKNKSSNLGKLTLHIQKLVYTCRKYIQHIVTNVNLTGKSCLQSYNFLQLGLFVSIFLFTRSKLTHNY